MKNKIATSIRIICFNFKIYFKLKHIFQVDYMLGSFMDEMQITPEQFEVACLEGRHTNSNSSQGGNNSSPRANDGGSTGFNFHHGLFQQIWAANDIRIFIRMMTQRNVELQLQALDLIERRQNSEHRDSGNFDEPSNVDVHGIHEMTVTDEKTIIQNHLDDGINDDILVDNKMNNSIIDNSQDKFNVEELASGNVEEKFQRLNLFFEKNRIDSADIKSRQEYLRNQRDQILKLKKKARTRQLNETIQKNGRPSSAQIAQKLMQGDINNEIEPSESSILLRKTLAKRLRTEVVNPDIEN